MINNPMNRQELHRENQRIIEIRLDIDSYGLRSKDPRTSPAFLSCYHARAHQYCANPRPTWLQRSPLSNLWPDWEDLPIHMVLLLTSWGDFLGESRWIYHTDGNYLHRWVICWVKVDRYTTGMEAPCVPLNQLLLNVVDISGNQVILYLSLSAWLKSNKIISSQ